MSTSNRAWAVLAGLLLSATAQAAPSPAPIYRETQAAAPNVRYYLSSRGPEVAAQFGWKILAPAFEAFLEPAPGTVPVYCETPIAAPHSSYHFSTRSEADAREGGWMRQFVAFYAYPKATPGTQAVYEETASWAAGSPEAQYNLATRTAEEAAQYGWTRTGVVFWVPVRAQR